MAITFLLLRLQAEVVDWHPILQGIRPGRGIDLRNQHLLKGQIALVNTNLPIGGGAGGFYETKVRFIQDTFDMESAFAMNAGLSVRGKFYSGSIGFSQTEGVASRGNQLSFAMTCGRVLPDELFTVERLDPGFANAIVTLKKSYTGPALEEELTKLYGNYFVSGWRKAFMAVMVYTFTFETQSSARTRALAASAEYNGGVAKGSFYANVADYFSKKDAKFTLTYEFRASNPFSPAPPFATNSVITNLDQFVAVSDLFENYCRTTDLTFAGIVNYTVEQFQNLPSYRDLIGFESPETIFLPNYARFMQVYSEFKGWDEQLFHWTGDARRMHWLNADGQKIVLAMRADVTRYLHLLEDTAKRHFQDGAPLEVSEEITNYRASLSKIPLPVIQQRKLRREEVPGGFLGLWIGTVDSGTTALTTERPFRSLTIVRGGQETGENFDVIYEPNSFVSWFRQFHSEYPWALDRFDQFIDSPAWTALVDDATRNRLGFSAMFLSRPTGFDWNGDKLAVKNGAGEIIETVGLLESGSAGTSRSVEGDVAANLQISSDHSPTLSLIDNETEYRIKVTNTGPGSAFGVSLVFPIPTDFELVKSGGSQGSGSVANGTLTYHVGSMAYGASAEIRFSLIPQRTGRLELPAPARLEIGDGLTDPSLTDNQLTLSALEVVEPRLSIGSNAGLVELRWQSASGRLAVEESTALNSANWSLPSGVASTDGDTSTLKISPATGQRFYRLRVQ